MMRKLILLSTLLTLAFSASALENLTVNGTTRTMIVYAPSGLPAHPALVIACHGANQDAPYLQSLSKWETVADTAKFVVVYANGINKYWDIGGSSDLNFMQAIIDNMYQRYSINRNRVYLTGFSMGGMFTYFAAAHMADKIAAFAPVSGYLMGGPNATASRPVPILHTHGTADDVCVYSSVQQHINAWVKFNGCSTTPEVIKPYPAYKPNSQAEMKRYKGGRNGVEVALLTLADKGHWWSMDPAQALTSEEVWNFCKRYTLGADAPEVTSIVPEDLSFDMLLERDNTFTVSFSDSIDCSKVKATLKSASATITLDVQDEDFQPTVTFRLPANATVADGEYTLTVSNAVTKAGGTMESITFNYIYGIQEVGETLILDTLYASNWMAERETVGEGIPTGWRRINTLSDGTTETLKGPAANCTGVRMKYFVPGGDFDAGFYFSARDNQSCALQYGFISGNMLKLKSGRYRASFKSTYWSEGALTAKATFDFQVMSGATTAVYTASSLPSTGTMKESTGQQVTGSQAHTCDFTISKDAYYAMSFTMTSGWNSVILGDVMLTTQPSVVETYKGTFYRTLLAARKALAGHEDSDAGKALLAVIDSYADFASTSPTAYTAATQTLQQAIEAFHQAEWSAVLPLTMPSVHNSEYYDLMGRSHGTCLPTRGIYIKDGRKHVIR